MTKIPNPYIAGKTTIPVYVCYTFISYGSSDNIFQGSFIDIDDTLIADAFIDSIVQCIARYRGTAVYKVCVISFNILPH